MDIKINFSQHQLLVVSVICFLLGCNLLQVAAQNADILSLNKINTWAFYDQVRLDFETNYKQRSEQLITAFNDHQSSNLNRSTAAYSLGLMRAENSVTILANEIKLEEDGLKEPVHGHISLGRVPQYPVVEALVEIGNPSIPAVMRNLAESDDTQVRRLSLQVLTRIDVDHDIDQLRLQKAIKNESDPQKQARLQAALKALPDADVKP